MRLDGPGPGRRRRPARYVDRARAAPPGRGRRAARREPGEPPDRHHDRAPRTSRADDVEPQLVVVAVPPDHLAEQVAVALTRHRARRSPTSAASRAPRWPPYACLAPDARSRATSAATRWPAASGPARSRPPQSLFDGRPWAVTPHDERRPGRRRAGHRAGRGLRGDPGAALPGRARPGGGPHLPPAAPARRAGRRPAHRRPRPSTSRCPGRASATSPGSRPATRGCGSRSSPPTPRR